MRTKQVFPNDELAHIWANQRQESGRNSAGNISFTRRKIYSYATVQAELMKDKEDTVFIVDYNYSNTTAKHLSYIRNAIAYKTKISVRYPADVRPYSENFWKNIEDMRANAINYLQDAEKPKIQAKTRIKNRELAVYELNRIIDFLGVFGLTIETLKNKGEETFKKPPLHCEKATFEYTVKLVKSRLIILDGDKHLLEEYTIQKDKAQKQKDKALAKQRAETLAKAHEYLAKWLKGENVDTYQLSIIPEIYLRGIPKGDATEAQTSWGARVTVKRAKVLYALLKGDLKKNANRILGFDIDGYKVVEASTEHLKVGCHIILKSEINRFAKKMKWSK